MAGKKGVGASAPTQIIIHDAEALAVGPDEVLVLRIPDMGDDHDMIVEEALAELDRIGLKDRIVVVSGDVEFAVVKKDG